MATDPKNLVEEIIESALTPTPDSSIAPDSDVRSSTNSEEITKDRNANAPDKDDLRKISNPDAGI